MAVHLTGRSFFLDVRQLTTRSEFAIPADDASARECTETKEPHQTHDSILRCVWAASGMPVELVVCARRQTEPRSPGTFGKWHDRVRTPPAVSRHPMFHPETWRVASWRRPKSQMGDPTAGESLAERAHGSQKLFFLGGVDITIVRQEIPNLRDLEPTASRSEFANEWLGTSQVRPRAGVPPPPAREQF